MEQTRPDVAIVGAGFAGLSAAEALGAAGLSCIILDARDRVGGRAWSVPLPGTDIDVDLGAEWLSPMLHRAANALAHRIGTGLEAAPRYGSETWAIHGRRMAGSLAEHAAARPALSGALARLRADMAAAADHDHETLETYLAEVAPDPVDRALMSAALAGLVDTRFDVVTAAEVLRRLRAFGSAPLDGLLHPLARVAGGTGRLAGRLAATLPGPLLLERPVTAIAQDGTGVSLHGPWGSVSAGAALVTAPLAALAGIAFSPPLSAQKAALVAGRRTGGLHIAWAHITNRRFDLISRAWPAAVPLAWVRGRGPDGAALCARMPAGTIQSGAGPAALAAALSDTMPDLRIATVIDHDWAADRWAGGSSMAGLDGPTTTVAQSFASPEGRVHFASGDTAAHWPGWIEGALSAGQAAAATLISHLGRGTRT